MAAETKAALAGSTGLVGSHILSTLLSHPSISNVTTFSRNPITQADPHSRLSDIDSKESATWAASFPASPAPDVFFSGLGTTRANAGGFENQRKIDHDLNLELAKAAKTAGVKVYVLISSAGASSSSMFGYPKMKGELDEAVQELGFEKTIILRPGMIVGERRKQDVRALEFGLRKLAGGMGMVSGNRLKDFWAQDADVIARAAVNAALKSLKGEAPEGKGWILAQSDIVRLGRTEWKES